MISFSDWCVPSSSISVRSSACLLHHALLTTTDHKKRKDRRAEQAAGKLGSKRAGNQTHRQRRGREWLLCEPVFVLLKISDLHKSQLWSQPECRPLVSPSSFQLPACPASLLFCCACVRKKERCGANLCWQFSVSLEDHDCCTCTQGYRGYTVTPSALWLPFQTTG